jgi:hypothetical protein
MKFDEKRLNSIEMKLKRNVTESNKQITEDYLWALFELRKAWGELDQIYEGTEVYPGVQEIQGPSDSVALKDTLAELKKLIKANEVLNNALFENVIKPTQELTARVQERSIASEKAAQVARAKSERIAREEEETRKRIEAIRGEKVG